MRPLRRFWLGQEYPTQTQIDPLTDSCHTKESTPWSTSRPVFVQTKSNIHCFTPVSPLFSVRGKETCQTVLCSLWPPKSSYLPSEKVSFMVTVTLLTLISHRINILSSERNVSSILFVVHGYQQVSCIGSNSRVFPKVTFYKLLDMSYYGTIG